jgi:hypothetical protein
MSSTILIVCADGGNYGRTVSGKRITDALIGELARKVEVGYEIEEMGQGFEGSASDPDRAARLRLLARRLCRANGLDRDALKR